MEATVYKFQEILRIRQFLNAPAFSQSLLLDFLRHCKN